MAEKRKAIQINHGDNDKIIEQVTGIKFVVTRITKLMKTWKEE